MHDVDQDTSNEDVLSNILANVLGAGALWMNRHGDWVFRDENGLIALDLNESEKAALLHIDMTSCRQDPIERGGT